MFMKKYDFKYFGEHIYSIEINESISQVSYVQKSKSWKK